MPAEPIHTAENTRIAYQLIWSYSLFWKQSPPSFDWLDRLQQITETDGIRILSHRFILPNVSQFLISTQPQVSPQLVAQRVKGRLQHELQASMPKAFHRNYALRSIGLTKREKVDAYIALQLDHHPLADSKVSERFKKYQIHNEEVDLQLPGRPRTLGIGTTCTSCSSCAIATGISMRTCCLA